MCVPRFDNHAVRKGAFRANPYEDTTKGKDHEALEGPMTRGRLKQAQHSHRDKAGHLYSCHWWRLKAQVEKDEGLEAEALPRLLIVAEGPS